MTPHGAPHGYESPAVRILLHKWVDRFASEPIDRIGLCRLCYLPRKSTVTGLRATPTKLSCSWHCGALSKTPRTATEQQHWSRVTVFESSSEANR